MSLRRKKTATIALVAALAVFGFISGFASPSTALAWDNCPKGLVNDPYPGACRRYVDTNSDGICDLSQPEPSQATTTTTTEPPQTTTTTTKKETTTTTTVAVATATSGEPPTGDCPLGPCAGCGACLSLGAAVSTLTVADSDDDDSSVLLASVSDNTGTGGGSDGGTTSGIVQDGSAAGAASTVAAATDSTSASISQTVRSSLLTQYNVSPIAIGFFLVYAVSFVLYKTKRIGMATHRKVWNVLLLATFLITGIFGLILTIQLDYQLPFRIPFDILFWHVEAGVVMTLISLFHIGWHFNYYKNLVRSTRKKVKAAHALERMPSMEQPGLVVEAREQRRAERELERAALRRDTRGAPTARPQHGLPSRPELGTDV